MSDYNNQDPFEDQGLSQLFDQDYGVSSANQLTVIEKHQVDFLDGSPNFSWDSSSDFFQYQDPLKHVYKFQFKPLHLDLQLDSIHFVKPHQVDSYIRKDGTFVEGYYRDGDGDTRVNRPLEAGGGYVRSNPDGIEGNNLKR